MDRHNSSVLHADQLVDPYIRRRYLQAPILQASQDPVGTDRRLVLDPSGT